MVKCTVAIFFLTVYCWTHSVRTYPPLHCLSSLTKKIVMCCSRKYPYITHRRDWNFLGGSVRPKNLKKCTRLNSNFQRGGGFLEKIPSVGEVWIFSGIIQLVFPSCKNVCPWKTPFPHRILSDLPQGECGCCHCALVMKCNFR